MTQYPDVSPAAQGDLPTSSTGYVSDLDTPLLMFSEADVWTLRDACEGVFITGGVGSGKTSGSGAAVARAYLKAGFGGIVCCATVNEADRWRRYAAETGRADSLIVMDKSLAHRFNFLDYQMTVGRGSTNEAVTVLLDILDAAEGRYEGAGGGSGDQQFWQTSTRQLLSNSLAPLWAAYGRITLPELVRFVNERPTRAEHLNPETGWIDRSFWARTIKLAERGGFAPIAADEFEPVWTYWTSESDMMAADQKTAANIVKTVTGKLDPFLTGALRQLFTTGSTFVPEMTFEAGALIVLDLSAHEWGKEGIFAQHIVKTMWQRAMQRRVKHETMRAAFCAADECQTFLADTDRAFTNSSRECRGLNVYLTQNLPGIYAKLGQGSENIADSILGNLATKFFHAQSDARTAEWAATMIGKAVTYRYNMSENEGRQTGGGTSSSSGGGPSGGQSGTSTSDSASRGTGRGASETMDYRLQPSHFTTLKKGGGADRLTEAVVFQAGRVFDHSGSTWTPVLFRQG